MNIFHPKINETLDIEDWPFYTTGRASIDVIVEPAVHVSELLGPDGEPVVYVQEYRPGFIEF